LQHKNSRYDIKEEALPRHFDVCHNPCLSISLDVFGTLFVTAFLLDFRKFPASQAGVREYDLPVEFSFMPMGCVRRSFTAGIAFTQRYVNWELMPARRTLNLYRHGIQQAEPF